ncbi:MULTISPECIES: TetR/AcrR family transcriptional regulator [unclassified Microbacterium]|uniref:TetR/AcrR family transcriptional regulator n=1 Tax=unclassified Microbacterium TaxID=2609290 RepID=UPI00214BB729|nr:MULTISPECIES: TetR/AcrR family transcriptional regulator [unclassified Microbacterium]MCR2783863.1 TetR/AcrR family transcriptional regulator [Microbacterium sp. zg.B96]WIM15291.1 TetR/AcrR family transcriptional regulator [Microbacterium sp. zg-B96]
METTKSSYHHGDLRAALVETGLELTRAGGPEALRLREATRRAGVTARAAYRHFADREALLAAVAARIQDEMAQSMSERMDAGESDDSVDGAVARLRGVGMGYIEFALHEPGWFQLAFFAPDGIVRPDGRTPPPLQLLREALDGLVAAGLLSAERRAGAEWSCWSTVHGFAELAIHGPLRGQDPADLRPLAAQAVDDVIAGIRREG